MEGEIPGERASASSGHFRPSNKDVGSAGCSVPGKVAKEGTGVGAAFPAHSRVWDWRASVSAPRAASARGPGSPAADGGMTNHVHHWCRPAHLARPVGVRSYFMYFNSLFSGYRQS